MAKTLIFDKQAGFYADNIKTKKVSTQDIDATGQVVLSGDTSIAIGEDASVTLDLSQLPDFKALVDALIRDYTNKVHDLRDVGFKVEVVESLPAKEDANTHTLYLVKRNAAEVTVEDDTAIINGITESGEEGTLIIDGDFTPIGPKQESGTSDTLSVSDAEIENGDTLVINGSLNEDTFETESIDNDYIYELSSPSRYTTPDKADVYNEYVFSDVKDDYELIGTTAIDVSNFVSVDYFNSVIEQLNKKIKDDFEERLAELERKISEEIETKIDQEIQDRKDAVQDEAEARAEADEELRKQIQEDIKPLLDKKLDNPDAEGVETPVKVSSLTFNENVITSHIRANEDENNTFAYSAGSTITISGIGALKLYFDEGRNDAYVALEQGKKGLASCSYENNDGILEDLENDGYQTTITISNTSNGGTLKIIALEFNEVNVMVGAGTGPTRPSEPTDPELPPKIEIEFDKEKIAQDYGTTLDDTEIEVVYEEPDEGELDEDKIRSDFGLDPSTVIERG